MPQQLQPRKEHNDNDAPDDNPDAKKTLHTFSRAFGMSVHEFKQLMDFVNKAAEKLNKFNKTKLLQDLIAHLGNKALALGMGASERLASAESRKAGSN